MGSLRTSLTVISCANKSVIIIMFGKVCALLCLVAVAQAQKAEHRSGESEDSARLLFSNYTSGLISLFPVNSTTYSTVSLIVAGAAVALAVAYLFTTSPASFQTQSQSQFRGFKGMAQGMDLDLLGLVSTAMKVYSALNDEDEE
eukprot:TRINITY_DN5668_c0_g1_i2.p1 TRINITY_DN5668_c0_g1~~TRINITY_DN5668_c0_g1_i2.p1  ORF type:complete len:167 (-),score=60.77 TRINITY_DN5668_c0_g1_i2:110-541(-)